MSTISSVGSSEDRQGRFTVPSAPPSAAVSVATGVGKLPQAAHASVRALDAGASNATLATLTPDQVRLQEAAERWLRDGIVNPELRQVLAEGGNAGVFGNMELNPAARKNAFMRFVLDVFNNNFENKTAMILASVFNLSCRAASGVLLMTFLRQESFNALSADKGFTEAQRTAVGAAIAGLLPILLTAGGVKDYIDGVATLWSSVGRVALALGGVSSLALTAAFGKLPDAAPALVAYSLQYCGGRETSQLFLRTPGQTSGVRLPATFASGVMYFLVQALVGAGMSFFAPGSSGRADIERAAMNHGGETADETNLAWTHLFQEGWEKAEGGLLSKSVGGFTHVKNNFRNRFSMQNATRAEWEKMLLGSWPGRAELFALLSFLNVFLPGWTSGLSPVMQTVVSVLADAAAMGLLIYCFFGGTFDSKPAPRARGWETQLEAGLGPSVRLENFSRPGPTRMTSRSALLEEPTPLETPSQSVIWGRA